MVNPPALKVTSNVVLGHCRKASSGGKLDVYAQPIVLFKKDLNMSLIKDTHMISALKNFKDEDIVFSGIHNGTIENYLDLADEYEISTENHNDTKVLLTILFYGKYDVLSKYTGTAALIWHNHALNKSYVFKGESKSWDTVATTSEERPLYACIFDYNNVYFSSLKDSLKIIQDKKSDEDVIEIKSNTLYKFRDGINYQSSKIDRSKCTQNKVYRSIGTRSSEYWNGRSEREIQFNNYVDQDEYKGGEMLPWEKPTKFPERKGEDYVRKFAVTGQDSFRIAFEKPDNFTNRFVKKVIYNKTRYWMNGNLMHGVYALSQGGIVPSNVYTKEMIYLKLYYFIEGVLMDGVQAYKAALPLHNEFVKDLHDILLDSTYTEEAFIFNIAKYSRYPVAPLLNTDSNQVCFTAINRGLDPEKNQFTGEFQPLFSFRKYAYDHGKLTGISEVKTFKSFIHDQTDHFLVQQYLKEVKNTTPMDFVYSIGANLLNSNGSYTNPLSPFQKLINNEIVLNNYLDNILINDTLLYLVCYLRDFNTEMKDDCSACASEDTVFSEKCSHCQKLRVNYETQLTRRFNELYN